VRIGSAYFLRRRLLVPPSRLNSLNYSPSEPPPAFSPSSGFSVDVPGSLPMSSPSLRPSGFFGHAGFQSASNRLHWAYGVREDPGKAAGNLGRHKVSSTEAATVLGDFLGTTASDPDHC
jgi:hypothetical protein